jgi:Protein of unknown function (DUF3153)
MGRTRAALAAAGMVAVALLTGGCLRVQVAAAVRADDTVTGELVIASVTAKPDEPGTVFSPPSDIAARVHSQPYREAEYAGTRLLFEGLTFEEFGRLNQVPGGEGHRLRLQLRRAGGLVLFTARVDLSQIPAPDKVDVGIRLSFPGRITSTNGVLSGNEVSWRPAAGQVTELNATARYADPGVLPWTRWAALVGGLALIVVIAVLLLALLAHRRSLRTA